MSSNKQKRINYMSYEVARLIDNINNNIDTINSQHRIHGRSVGIIPQLNNYDISNYTPDDQVLYDLELKLDYYNKLNLKYAEDAMRVLNTDLISQGLPSFPLSSFTKNNIYDLTRKDNVTWTRVKNNGLKDDLIVEINRQIRKVNERIENLNNIYDVIGIHHEIISYIERYIAPNDVSITQLQDVLSNLDYLSDKYRSESLSLVD
jgi:hypothetical protein